jgi:hypothetical protein
MTTKRVFFILFFTCSIATILYADNFVTGSDEKSAQALEKEYSRIKELYSSKQVSGKEKEVEYDRVKQLYLDQQATVAYAQERPATPTVNQNLETTPQVPGEVASGLEFGKEEFRKQISKMGESKKGIRALRSQTKQLNSQIRDARDLIAGNINEIDRLIRQVETRNGLSGTLNRSAGDVGRAMQYFVFGMGSFDDRILERAEGLRGHGLTPQEDQKLALWMQEIKEQKQIRAQAQEELKKVEMQLASELEKAQDVNKPIPFTSANMGTVTEEPPKQPIPGYRSGS